MKTQQEVDASSNKKQNHSQFTNSHTTLSKRSIVMNTKQIFRQGLWTLISLLLVAAIAFGQGVLKNGGTFRNTGTVTYKAVQNYTTSAGKIKNSGTINVTQTGGTKNFVNQDGAGLNGNVTNYIGGTGGTIVVGNNLDNGAAGAIFDNDTTGGTLSTLKIVGAITSTGTFDTDSGRVWYNGGAQTVFTTTYGTLIADQTGAKTIAATVTVNDSLRIDNSASVAVSTFQLDLKGATNIAQNSGALSAASGTVRYNGNRAQTLIPAQYNVLNLLGSTAGHVKTSPGAISFTATTGTLNISTTFDTLEVSSGVLDFTNLADARFTNSAGINISSTSAPVLGSITNVGNFDYNGTAGQTLAAGTYTNLTLRNTGAKAMPAGTVAVTGNYVIGSGAGARTYTGSTFQFAGTTAQTISNLAETFATLQFAGAGTKTIGGTSFGATRLDVLSGSGVVTNNVTTVTLTHATLAMTIAASTEFVNSASSTLTLTGDLENNGVITNEGTITVN